MSYEMSNDDIAARLIGVDFTGNVIPHSWYSTFQTETKEPKPYLAAIVILADILYWYRPIALRDEETLEFVGYQKKYKGDLVQRSYKQISKMLGLSDSQARRAVAYLEDKKVITRVFRDVQMKDGTVLNNTMYIDLHIEKLLELTYGDTPLSANLQIPPIKFADTLSPNLQNIHRLRTKNVFRGSKEPPASGEFKSKHAHKKKHQLYSHYLRYRRDGDGDYEDPRLYHPALRLWRGKFKIDVTGAGNWRDRIIEEVGDSEQSLKVWRESMEVWSGISTNKNAPLRVISIYRNGGVLDGLENFERTKKEEAGDGSVIIKDPLSADAIAEQMKGWQKLQESGLLNG